MKHLRYWSLTALAVLLVLLPTRACGPDFPTAVFVLPEAPDGDYAAFAAGHLGVLQPGFHSRSLAIAYRILTGPPLTPAEQQQAVAANTHFVAPDFGYTDGQPDPPLPGFTAWIGARASLGPVDNFLPTKDLATDRSLTDNSYDAFPNCLDPAFPPRPRPSPPATGSTDPTTPTSSNGYAARTPSSRTAAMAKHNNSSARERHHHRRPRRTSPPRLPTLHAGCSTTAPTNSPPRTFTPPTSTPRSPASAPSPPTRHRRGRPSRGISKPAPSSAKLPCCRSQPTKAPARR